MNTCILTRVLTLSIILIYLVLPHQVSASEDFKIDVISNYLVAESGESGVVNKITIENLKTETQATRFVFKLKGVEPENITVSEDSKALTFETLSQENHLSIAINFDKKVVGVGEKRVFEIRYQERTIVTKTGEIWEIAIPKLEDDTIFNTYGVILAVPQSFGNLAYINPNPSEKISDNQINSYYFMTNQIKKSGIAAGFGKFQVYNFNIKYHLQNSGDKKQQQEIAIPPDTAYQRLHYRNINPKPLQISVDEDGNWLAHYTLTPNQQLTVEIEGQIQVFASARKHLIPQPSNILSNLKPSDFWQTDAQEIKSLAAKLKTPENIYTYVVDNLNYDYGRTKNTNQRFGAVVSLDQKSSATCTEFTDLFIALARSAGIPAREINGFAYSESPEKEPVSGESDVLHAWPEYWDDEIKAWVPVDPTWGDTSNLNYFGQFDLKHIAFVIHGKSPIEPYPPGFYKTASNPQKDVFVTVGEFRENLISDPILSTSVGGISPFTRSVNFTVYNPGPTAIYDTYAQTFFDTEAQHQEFIKILSPFAYHTFEVKIPYSLLSLKSPDKLRFAAAGTEITVDSPKKQDMNIQLLAILVLFLVFISATVVKHFDINPGNYAKTIFTKITKNKPSGYN